MKRSVFRVIVWPLTVVLLISLMSCFSFPAFAGTVSKIMVMGVELISGSDDHTVSCGEGSASYDVSTNTLTLTNAVITTPSYTTRNAGIYADGIADKLTIKLVGDNSILLADTDKDYNGIWCDSSFDLDVIGDGKLDILLYNDSNAYGIYLREGDLTIKDSTFSFSLEEGSSPSSIMIDTDETVTFDNCDITAEDYMLTFWAGSGLTVKNDSNIDVTALEVCLFSDNDIKISDSTVSAQSVYEPLSAWGNTEITNSDVSLMSEKGNGIYCYGKVTVSGGKVTLESTNNDAFRANGGIHIKDNAEVTATSPYAAFYTNETMTVDSGKVAAHGGTWAVLARRVSKNDADSVPEEDAEALILGDGMVEITGATVKTEDWTYTEVYDDMDWEYYDNWLSRSYLVDADGNILADAVIMRSYDITYKAGENADGESVTDTKLDGDTAILKDAAFTRVGYTQTGWALTDGGEKAYDLGAEYTDDSSVTLYPVWTANKYKITAVAENGTVDLESDTVEHGKTVTATLTPAYGYIADAVTVKDKGGNTVAVTKVSDTEYSFVMPINDVVITAEFKKSACSKDSTCPINKFKDSKPAAWYHDGVHYCVENGIMVGLDENSFGPDTKATRAMIATVLWRLEGKKTEDGNAPFADVAEGRWYTDAIDWAYANKIVYGYTLQIRRIQKY